MTAALALAGVLFLWVLVVKAVYGFTAEPDELRFAVTDDGWRLALSRWRPAAGAPSRAPVLLCHGLGADRGTFDMGPGASLARRLAALGHDVWAVELRGRGRSERPGPFSGRWYRWTFDDFLLHDLPAAIALVKKESGSPRLHYIGHSMGGILLLAHLAVGAGGDLLSGTAIGSTLDYSGTDSDFRKIMWLKGIERFLPIMPFGPFGRLTAPFACRFQNSVDAFNIHFSNIDGFLYRKFMASSVDSASTLAMAQLATAFDPGGLRSRDGSTTYMEGLRKATTPVLFVAGDDDRQCPPTGARRSFEALGSSDKKLLVFGTASGHADHYGHCDLVLGKRAAQEVYPSIENWLAAHEARALTNEGVPVI